MTVTNCFYFKFLEKNCCVELRSPTAGAASIFDRYQAMFPAYRATENQPAELTVRIHDIAGLAAEALPAGLDESLRSYFNAGYVGIADAVLDQVVSPAYLGNATALALAERGLDPADDLGISLQKDFLVFSDRPGGQIDAFADVSASMQEAWGFHVLNFFKVFFFADDIIRLHGSGATLADETLLLLANTGGGKSTMKNFFLRDVSGPEPFTDDSILAQRTESGFLLYQDPVEFLRWCYMPEEALDEHIIPPTREAIAVNPAIFYLVRGDSTSFGTASGEDVLKKIKEEAFYQAGFLTQRFIPQPDAGALLQRYFDNTLAFLESARTHIAVVRHNDDYTNLFAEFKRQLGMQ